MSSPDDSDIDFAMHDIDGLDPEEAKRRRDLRARQSHAAAVHHLSAQANGAPSVEANRAARKAAARVQSLDAGGRKIDGAMADLSHLGQHHPAMVLLRAALELVEHEELGLTGRRGQA